MITWMQRHKKWLIITIWISTIAFIGAGFVGWGAYSYGDKASSVAKVGSVNITTGEFQKAYSNLYAQYSQVFQGQFDKEKAKALGLEKQAIRQLVNKALIENMAKEYDLAVSDEELFKEITSLPYFQTNGKFDKKVYKELLAKNNIIPKEFENQIRKDLLIQKMLKLLPTNPVKNEINIIDTLYNIADKVKYKKLSSNNIKLSVNEKELKKFWEARKDDYKTEAVYIIEYIIQDKVSKKYDENKLKEYYSENKTHFRGNDGKILSFEKAKEKVIAELDEKETKKQALKKYIKFKKGELKATNKENVTFSTNKHTSQTFDKIKSLSPSAPYLKPVKEGDRYIIIKLVSIIPSKTKTFAQAREEVLPSYMSSMKKEKLKELAKKSYKNFKGKTSDFITIKDYDKLTDLGKDEAKAFVSELFKQNSRNGYIVVDDENVILYNIVEQKLLHKTHTESKKIITGIKAKSFEDNLLKYLQDRYKIEIYYKGL